ncbi:MAG: dienelactone hydrolase family protein [Candidatus Dormibacteria bacterium]
MCYGNESLPPDHGLSRGIAGEESLTLTGADGNTFPAHMARSKAPTGRGVVILPDVRGLHNYYCALTRRFADAGVDAITFDYFGRSQSPVEQRDDSFDYMPLVQQLTPEQVAADVAAALAHLRSATGVEASFTLGFCMGGMHSWRQSAAQPGLAGAIGFYGRPDPARSAVASMKAPLLLLAAGADHTPVDEVEKFAGEVRSEGVEATVVVFPGAPHSFFDRTFAEHADACRRAWSAIFDFMGISA